MLELVSTDISKAEPDILFIPVCKGKQIHDDKHIVSLGKRLKTLAEFKGEKEDSAFFYDLPDMACRRIVFWGAGEADKLDGETFRAVAGKCIRLCMKKGFSSAGVAVPAPKKTGLSGPDMVAALMEGACLGNHVFDRYKKEKKETPASRITFFAKPGVVKSCGNMGERILEICRGAIFARELVSTPANDKRPEDLRKAVSTEAENAGLDVTTLDEDFLKEKQFGAILAVAAGSEGRPCMTILEYAPKGARKTVVLAGKGVTFDSGGLNLKTSGFMETMKCDMAGAAAVAATMITLTKLQPRVRVIGVMPMVENMPSGRAARPGDVIRTYSGRTVEIGNTDAEGRLILADAISYAIEQYKPDVLIDLATLTGACVVALGEKIAGVFTADDDLADAMIASGRKTHERCWRLPLPDDYKELLKSDVADTNNMSSTRYGGAITAALFLSEFAKETRWAHIDIAGPAYSKKSNAYCGPGGTGFGVRLLCDWIGNFKG